MSMKPKRIDPRVRRTRQLLQDAFTSLIQEKGYEAITVQDITERATLNRATFYLHYRDKQDLMWQSTEEVLSELVDSLRETTKHAKKADLHVDQPHPVFVCLFEQIARHATFYKVMLSHHQAPLAARLIEVITDYISQGLDEFQPDDTKLTAQREIIVRYTASAFLGVIMWWLEGGMSYSPRFMALQLMRLAIKGPYELSPFA
ncbi:TetR family transcriptional regulator [Brevibacillus borstelensis cifa_chp40]|nr:TetR family transcriptional regulator [Brevibacillus borstelensis cifa_chp40]